MRVLIRLRGATRAERVQNGTTDVATITAWCHDIDDHVARRNLRRCAALLADGVPDLLRELRIAALDVLQQVVVGTVGLEAARTQAKRLGRASLTVTPGYADKARCRAANVTSVIGVVGIGFPSLNSGRTGHVVGWVA